MELAYDPRDGDPSLASSIQKLKSLAGGSCACSQPTAAGAATALELGYDGNAIKPPVQQCTSGIMTPAGWCFFGLALAVLIIALVLVSVEQGQGQRFDLA